MVPWYVYLEALFCLSGFSYLETALFCGCVYAAKKPTRQWAAWTHQEEECFFTALRQVGKNFLKITSHVQSKNKDQVGHYYCRLVRRMNKLLGPELMTVWIHPPPRVHIASFEMSRLPLALHLFGDDEDTHDAFSFQKNRLAGSSKLANVASPGGGEPSHLVEATSGDEGPCNFPDQQRDPMEEGPTTINSPGKKTLCGFADPDSLGPTDLDIRSSKYPEDLNLNKSLDGLRRLIATSLDAFQNCSVFGFDSKKDTSNMV
ncbi:unnamed protein product [Brassica napus]|uniref:(rape) hypothetical protein n=1 Tax=Brassica napus TaxID=3708 RepID=A0A817AWJ4_BRANA|nr:unnamed protein product [Brassica napus]